MSFVLFWLKKVLTNKSVINIMLIRDAERALLKSIVLLTKC